MAENFLTKSGLDRSACLSVNDDLALDQYSTLQEELTQRAGPETAALFAEPLLSRGNDVAEGSVTWYTDFVGSGTPLFKLDETAQQKISAKLARALMPLEALVDDPEIGGLVSAALYVEDTNAFWVVDNHPILINWGTLPGGADADRATRAAHFAKTTGRFLPMDPPPGVSNEERAQLRVSRAAVAAGAVAAAGVIAGGAAAASSPSVTENVSAASPTDTPLEDSGNGTDETDPQDRRRVPVYAWLPLVILLLLAAGTLYWLLVPGNRLFPKDQSVIAQAENEAIAMADALNDDLRRRLATLQSARDTAQCYPDGTLVIDGTRTIDGLLPPDPENPMDHQGAVVPGVPTPILPPSPERTIVTPSNPAPAEAGGNANLLEVVERRTALVIAASSNGLSTGSGFFVAPNLLVTNLHVIAGARADGLYVTSETMGQALPATVVKTNGPFEETGGDFALLQVQGASQPVFEIFRPTSSLKLTAVVAAGYPGDVIRSDADFSALMNGQSNAAPDLIVTNGTVNSEQNYRGLAGVVVHSAGMSQGNSGGPLVDTCGRIVGVNTFANRGELRSWNFALDSAGLLAFLQGTPAAPATTSAPCSPVVQRPGDAQPVIQNDAGSGGAQVLPPLENE